jgi:pimeloyl-ACP methyl ester carboxylesterase
MRIRIDDMADVQYLYRPDGEKIAYRKSEGTGPGIVWVGGFRSDMQGTKARFLAEWAESRGRAMLRFDHFAHGRSSGDFRAATVTRWRDDAIAVFDRLSAGPQIVVGSSMGGWISNLLIRARPQRIAGVLWLAPAPDFTEDLMWDLMTEEARREILEKGEWMFQSGDDSYPITRALIESGRENLVLGQALVAPFPVRILHGLADTEVPWRRTLKLIETIAGDVRVCFLKTGGHRLSAPSELRLIARTLDGLIEDIGA